MSSHESTAPQTSELDYEPDEPQDEWLDEPDQLPRRPRRRLLAPVPLALLAVLLVACGFIAGVLVQKGQAGTTAAGGGAFASRLAALKGAAPGAGGAGGAAAGVRPGGGSTSATSGGGAGTFPGLGESAGGGVTAGEVAYVRGHTLYVTDSQGNTVKVNASAGAKVTKTVSTKAKSIRPGSTVVVLGAKTKNGAVNATSITVSSAVSSAATGSAASSSSTGARGSSAPTLFGPG